MQYKPGVCTFCGTGCGHFLKIEEGTAAGVYPSLGHPVSQGRLCVRGWHVHELLRTRQRLLQPCLGRGEARPVTYAEAFERAAEALRGVDPERVGILASPRSSNEELHLLTRLARGVLGTGNLSVDAQSGHYDGIRILADCGGEPGALGSFEAIRSADLLWVVDFDVARQNPIIGSELHMAAREGARLVTLDSRRTQIAHLSHRFLQIRPGSTALTLAALAKIILMERWYDPEYLREFTHGMDGFEAALDGLHLPGLEQKVGINVTDLYGIAEDLVSARSALAFYPSGISGLTEDTVRALYNVFLLAGKVGRSAGGLCPVTGLNNLQGATDQGISPDRLPGYRPLDDPDARRVLEEAWGPMPALRRGRRMFELWSKQAPMDALIVIDHDEGFVRYPEAVQAARQVILIGAYKTPFEPYADVILPVSTYAETEGTFTNADRRVQLSPRKLAAPEGVMEPWRVYVELARRLGQEWSYRGPAEIFDEITRVNPWYSGITCEMAAALGGVRWPLTPRPPVRMKFAFLEPTFPVPEARPEFPFLLMIGKAQHYWHQNNLMRKTHIPMREYNATLLLYPEGFIEICRQDAEALKVRDKWPVQVTSAAGSMEIKVKVSDDVSAGTAYVPYFVKGMISRFLLEHRQELRMGENASIPIRIERLT